MNITVRTTALVAALTGLGIVAAPAQALAPSGGTLTQITAATAEQGETWGNLRGNAEVSNDGRYVLFATSSPGIVTGDGNGVTDVFLHDTTTGVVTLVSHTATGAAANNYSSNPTLSANGKFISFDSQATDLAGAANADVTQALVYRYSVATGRIKLVSKAPNGSLPASGAFHSVISATGRYIAYTSRAHNIVRGDHNSDGDVFRYDATTDQTIKISQTPTGQETDKASSASAISGNGRYVAWRTIATNMGPADTNNDEDAYVSDVETGTTTLVSHNASGTAVGGRPTGISDSGKIVALTSASDQLALQDTDNVEDAYVYNAATDSVRLISVPTPEGAIVSALTSSISANGRYIAFSGLAVNDDINHGDVYLYDRQTRVSTTISVRPDGAPANSGSADPAVSRSGNFFAFSSLATNLVGDTHGIYDVFLWSRTLG